MPTILRIDGFRFFFFSLEGNESHHIHVENGDKVAKFWLKPVNLASSFGVRSHELTKIRTIICNNRAIFLEKWDEYFSN